MTIKIGLTGVHGSGKTTAVMKMKDCYVNLGNTVHVVAEIARSCPYTLRSVNAQEWIWNEQLARESAAMSLDVDIIICDRTVLDNLMYYRDLLLTHDTDTLTCQYHDHIHWWDLYQEALDWIPSYTRIIRLPLNLEWLQSDDPIRSKNVVYARRIDALFDHFVQPHTTL